MHFDVPFYYQCCGNHCHDVLPLSHCISQKNISGGIVGKKWNFKHAPVMIFTAGSMASSFFGMLPENILRLIVEMIFFFGAIYVVITVKLIYKNNQRII
ncbi:hypothetical protein BMS3Abin07_00271 [bacterium BMS3Abin07]|nr:hypothetical protein BMS3Abin07_00271 [bacterium BMS3Abin07]HDO22927.1 hypothetical protein [Nitrospirota bacterium]